MPFIGNPPSTSFQARPATQEFNGDGSTTTFTLNQTVTQEDIVVSVDGVVQESVDAYTVPNGTTLTFTAAPSSGTGNIFVIYLGTSVGSVTPAAQNKGNFKGGGLFRTNAQSLTANTTILATENANVTGPFTVASGVTLTVESGGTLVTL
jgi:hypothetical protein